MQEPAPFTIAKFPWIEVLAAALAAVLAQYLGAAVLIPGLGVALAGWVMRRWLRPRDSAFVPALCLIAGHLAWMAVAAVLAGDAFALHLEIAVYVVALAWLGWRPSLWAVGVITVIWITAIVWHVEELRALAWGSATHQAVATHLTLRILVVLSLCWGVWCGVARRSPKATSGAS